MTSFLVISSVLLWIIVLFNLLLTFALIKRNNAENGKEFDWLKIGSQAPDFVATDLKNETVTLDSFDGKTVLFVFISSNCRSCDALFPQLPEISLSVKKDNIELVLVSLSDNKNTVELVEIYGITLPVIIAPRHSSSFTIDYKVGATPFFCLIDKDKCVQDTGYFSPEQNAMTLKWSFNLAQ